MSRPLYANAGDPQASYDRVQSLGRCLGRGLLTMAEAAATVAREARGYLPPGANLPGFSIRLNWAMLDEALDTARAYECALDVARQALHPDRAPDIHSPDDVLNFLEENFPILLKADMRQLVRQAIADQRQTARDLLGPSMARGIGGRAASIAMLHARCPVLTEPEIAQIVDEQAARWLLYRHDRGLGAGSLKTTKIAEPFQ